MTFDKGSVNVFADIGKNRQSINRQPSGLSSAHPR
jgi:hypothetical protein